MTPTDLLRPPPPVSLADLLAGPAPEPEPENDERGIRHGLFMTTDQLVDWLLPRWAKTYGTLPCVACGKRARNIIGAVGNQLHHDDGSSNDRCWLRILRDELACGFCGHDSWDERIDAEDGCLPRFWLACSRCDEEFIDVEAELGHCADCDLEARFAGQKRCHYCDAPYDPPEPPPPPPPGPFDRWRLRP